jgi:hypothetical protein
VVGIGGREVEDAVVVVHQVAVAPPVVVEARAVAVWPETVGLQNELVVRVSHVEAPIPAARNDVDLARG